MKLLSDICRARRAGFTLPEILIAMTIFTVLLGAVVALQLFGVRIYQFAATKLTATRDARNSMNFIQEQIREAKSIYIGSFSGTFSGSTGTGTFTSIVSTNQVGSALLLFPTTAENYGSIFYENPTNQALCSVLITNSTTSNSGITTGTIMNLTTNALFVTNSYVFQAEDYLGNILQNNQNDRIIHVTLQFSQLEYPVAGIGKGAMYDYYELHTRAVRRTLD
ncbi:MAG TPA: prepilin-type N-terminal cleavage/methylation domain-containing protein [Candidatus Paceibacterota bacterium]|nr:prepilin-type N-terminal cleavage/methylation domain-containing protein [Candidatus Paceibacterota bacterium]